MRFQWLNSIQISSVRHNPPDFCGNFPPADFDSVATLFDGKHDIFLKRQAQYTVLILDPD